MGKRLVRIFNPDIVQKIDQLKEREIDVVMFNKSTLHGWFVRFKDHQLEVKDNKGTVHNIPVANIEEVIYDLVSAY